MPKVSQEETMKIVRELEAELNASYIAFSKDTLAADHNSLPIKFEKIYRRFYKGGEKKR